MIKWFKNAGVYDKPKMSVKPPSKTKVPKVPKSSPTKKVKKTFKGPKSPEFYKRKLYVPQPFIHAHLDLFAGRPRSNAETNPDGSKEALDIIAGMGPITKIVWHSNSSDPCDNCNARLWGSQGRWEGDDALVSFLADHRNDDQGHERMLAVTLFHKQCSCFIRVTVDGVGTYILEPGGDYRLESSSGPGKSMVETIPQAVVEKLQPLTPEEVAETTVLE